MNKELLEKLNHVYDDLGEAIKEAEAEPTIHYRGITDEPLLIWRHDNKCHPNKDLSKLDYYFTLDNLPEQAVISYNMDSETKDIISVEMFGIKDGTTIHFPYPIDAEKVRKDYAILTDNLIENANTALQKLKIETANLVLQKFKEENRNLK